MKGQNKHLLNIMGVKQDSVVLCKTNFGGVISSFFSFYISKQNAQKDLLDRSSFIR